MKVCCYHTPDVLMGQTKFWDCGCRSVFAGLLKLFGSLAGWSLLGLWDRFYQRSAEEGLSGVLRTDGSWFSLMHENSAGQYVSR